MTIILRNGGKGHLPTKIARRAGYLTNFFNCPGGGGNAAVGVDSHISMTVTLLENHSLGLFFHSFTMLQLQSTSSQMGHTAGPKLNHPTGVLLEAVCLRSYCLAVHSTNCEKLLFVQHCTRTGNGCSNTTDQLVQFSKFSNL